MTPQLRTPTASLSHDSLLHCAPSASDRQPHCIFGVTVPLRRRRDSRPVPRNSDYQLALVVVLVAAFTSSPTTGVLGLALGVMLEVFSLCDIIAFSVMADVVAERESNLFASILINYLCCQLLMLLSLLLLLPVLLLLFLAFRQYAP